MTTNTDIDFQKIEKKVWASFFQDGLLDIVMGLFMITPGVRILTDNVWFSFGFAIAALVLIIGKRVTASRLGKVKFGPERTRKLFKGHMLFSATLLAVLAVWVIILGDIVKTPVGVHATALGLGILAICCSLARYMDLHRFYIYGMLLGTGWALLEMDYEPAGPIAFIIAGSITVITGIAIFIRFLKKYPRPFMEDMNLNA
jgi:hypothetical protein